MGAVAQAGAGGADDARRLARGRRLDRSCFKKGRPGSGTPVWARPGRPARRVTSEPDGSCGKSDGETLRYINYNFPARCLMRVVAAILQDDRQNVHIDARSGVSGKAAVCNQHKEANHDDVVGTYLQALSVGGGRMRRWRSNNARYCGYPPGSSSKNPAKGGQVPGHAEANTEGRRDVQQLQALRGSELLPDR